MDKRTETYNINKAAKCGVLLVCTVCGSTFTKHQHQQAFCCGKCKDAYWNKRGDRHSKGLYDKYDKAHPGRRFVTDRQKAAVRLCDRYGFVFFGDINNWWDVKRFLNDCFDEAYEMYLRDSGDWALGDDQCESFRCYVDDDWDWDV